MAAFVLAIAAFAAATTARLLGDFDLPWHLATGRVIAQTHAVPTIDPLAYTHEPLRYVEPLGDLLLWGVYRGVGPLGLQLLSGVVSIAVAASLFLQARRSALVFGVVSLLLAALVAWLVVRPATLSFAFLSWELLLIEMHRRAPDERRARIALASLPALLLVWGNVHGFVSIGVWLVLAYLVVSLVERRVGPRFFAIVAASAVVAGCLNPGGPRVLLGPARFSEDLGAVADFARTSPAFLFRQEPLTLVVAALGLLALVVRGEERRTWWDLGLVLGGLAGYALAIRTIPLGMPLMAPVIVRRLGAVQVRGSVQWALAMTPLFSAAQSLIHADTAPGIGFDRTHFPTRAVSWIESAAPQGHMWNFWPYGGYLALALHPRHLVLMDGRNALARSPDLTRELHRSEASAADFLSLTVRYDLQWAIVNAREGAQGSVPIMQSSEWTMVHLDDLAAVYVRRSGPNAALAGAGYRWLRHLTPPEQALRLAVEGGAQAADLAHDGALARAQDPDSARSAFFGACGALAVRDRAAFEASWAALSRLVPEHPGLRVLSEIARAVLPR